MYDITRKDSFAAVPGWIAELRRNAGASAESLVIAIVGNKRDLESKREVSVEQGAALAESLRALSFETSALTVRRVHVQTHDCRMVCVCVCVCVRVCTCVCITPHHAQPLQFLRLSLMFYVPSESVYLSFSRSLWLLTQYQCRDSQPACGSLLRVPRAATCRHMHTVTPAHTHHVAAHV
jgi:hypothetical protein